ncbi:MBL fold metallo-hydrolase [Prevotella cerevisiae]|uniref:MBL fold metallo-hydrolase n=1 Tax=Segatella cerevisiae TaxID=2053716 RepID=A0ABT1BU84_9BACT|nr:MBL fold metallo-hydrolase [Segatella cerevisiae]MCH3993654.1 MBL fold metallo-hydrolase [Prevotella sp.]MCO6024645.1 MBL fold metallo-hydrolase [Segatella cerevisiae]
MMNIQRFQCNMLQENCYVVSDETKECIIVDCGAYYEEERQAVVKYIKDNKLEPKHLIVTHGHLDHNFGNNTIFKFFGLKPEVAEGDAHLMQTLKKQASKFYQLNLDYDFPPIDHFFEQDEIIKFGNHEFSIIETPGHSKGSVTFYCASEHVAFTGDTLFKHSIGRTDFAGGSMFLIIQSLRKLAQLPDDTIVLPGHGDQTTIGDEVAVNPYMDR